MTGSAASLNTLVASGDGDGSQGSVLLIIILLFAIVMVVMAIVGRFQQPIVMVQPHPFKLLMKAVVVGATTAVVAVAVVSILIATAGSPS